VKLAFGRYNLAITANSPEGRRSAGEAWPSTIRARKWPSLQSEVPHRPAQFAWQTMRVFIELIDELSPGVLKISGPFLYVVMPMRLS